MADETHRETLEELRDRVDAAAQKVARLIAQEEKLSERLPVAKREAEAAEGRLAEARAGQEGIISMAFDHMGTLMFLLPFLPLLGIPVALILGISEACDDTPYTYRATGTSVTSSILAAPPATPCEVVISEAPEGGCHAQVRCADVIFDGKVDCEMGAREEVDSEGDSTTVHYLIALDKAHEPTWLKVVEGEIVAEVRSAEGETRMILHEEESEGEL